VRGWPTSGHEKDGNVSKTDGTRHLTTRNSGRRTSFRRSPSPRGGQNVGRGRRRDSRRASGDDELEGLLALGRRPESGEEPGAAGDRHAADEGAFRARRWPTSGEKGEGVYWGPVFISGRRGGGMSAIDPVAVSPQVSTVQSLTTRK
jgi:hypothetical protein